MHKRGQVTVFIILGLLILIVLAIVFYLYGEKLKFQTKEEGLAFAQKLFDKKK